MSHSDKHIEQESFFSAAKLIAALTMFSRILGLVRDQAIISMGASRIMDSFWAAFSVPNLFRRLFGEGALTGAFVPVFTEVSQQPARDRPRLVLANVIGLTALLLSVIALLGELGLVSWLVFFRGSDDSVLLVQLTMILLPYMVTVCMLALASAALQCKGKFAYPALAPILLNVFMIAGALTAKWWFVTGSSGGLYVLSGAVVVAGFAQLAGIYWLLNKVSLAAIPRIKPILPEVMRVIKLTGPMMIPLGIVQFSAFFDRFYAWFMTATKDSPMLILGNYEIQKPLSEGVVTCLYAANRLYQFPMGILAISIATVVFPLFSRYASRGDITNLRGATNRALRLCLFLGIPSGAALFLLSDDLISLIFQHGEFSDTDVVRAGGMLRMYCLGMWAYFCNQILLRAFFSQKDYRTPLRLACVLAGLNVLLSVFLIFTPLKASAIALATAITASINTIMLAWFLRKRWGSLGLREILISTLRTLMLAAVMIVAMISSSWVIGAITGNIDGKFIVMLMVGVSVILGGGVFLAGAYIGKCPELQELLAKKTRKTGKTL